MTVMLLNNGSDLPGRYSHSGVSGRSSDEPGRELVRYYEQQREQK